MSRRTGLGRGLAALIPPGGGRESLGPAADEGTRPHPRVEQPGPGDADAQDTEPPSPPVAPTDPPQERDRHGPEHEYEGVAPEPRPDPGPVASVPSSTATYLEVSPSSIVPNPRQPREVFDPGEIEGLAVSLRDVGILQPLVVRPAAPGRYELIAGERRLRAARHAGLELVPVLVRHTDDADLLKEALVENIHRVQLNPLEEAAAYEQLLEEFGVSQEELATRLGRSRPAISNSLRLLRLPPAVQRRVAAGVLSAGHAKALLALDGPDAQSRLADRIVSEGLSVRAVEELVRLRVLDQDQGSGRRRRAAPSAPGLVELQEDLSDALEARVRITMGARKGRLAIDFSSVDDLERIVGVIANGLGRGETTASDTSGVPPA